MKSIFVLLLIATIAFATPLEFESDISSIDEFTAAETAQEPAVESSEEESMTAAEESEAEPENDVAEEPEKELKDEEEFADLVEDNDGNANLRPDILAKMDFCKRPWSTTRWWPQCGYWPCNQGAHKEECNTRCASWCATLRNTNVPQKTRALNMLAAIQKEYQDLVAKYPKVDTDEKEDYFKELEQKLADEDIADVDPYEHFGLEKPDDEAEGEEPLEISDDDMPSFEDVNVDEDDEEVKDSDEGFPTSGFAMAFREKLDNKEITFHDYLLLDKLPFCFRPKYMTNVEHDCHRFGCKNAECQRRCPDKCKYLNRTDISAKTKYDRMRQMIRKTYTDKVGLFPLPQHRLDEMDKQKNHCLQLENKWSFEPKCSAKNCVKNKEFCKRQNCLYQCGTVMKEQPGPSSDMMLQKLAENCFFKGHCPVFTKPKGNAAGHSRGGGCFFTEKQVPMQMCTPDGKCTMHMRVEKTQHCGSGSWFHSLWDHDRDDEDEAKFDAEAEPKIDLAKADKSGESMPAQE